MRCTVREILYNYCSLFHLGEPLSLRLGSCKIWIILVEIGGESTFILHCRAIMVIVEASFSFEIIPKTFSSIFWRPSRRRISPWVARRMLHHISIFWAAIIQACACTCWFVIVIDKGADWRYWKGFAMDEDLHGLTDATLRPEEWIRTSRVSGSIPPLYSESLSLAAASQHVSALEDL